MNEILIPSAPSNHPPELTLCFCPVGKNTFSKDIWRLNIMLTDLHIGYFQLG